MPTSQIDEGRRAASPSARAFVAASALFLIALVGFLAWQYLTPPALRSVFGNNHRGIAQFRAAFGVERPPVGLGAFKLGFFVLQAALWGAYLLVVRMVARAGAGGLSRRLVLGTAAAASASLWLLWPVAFSTDVYGYVAYGRLAVDYGRNPYLTSQKALAGLGDPTAPFLSWDLVSPYGPLWTWLSIGTIWLTRRVGLFGQVLGMKAIAVAGVWAIARAGAALAERLDRGRGPLTFAALALNPLVLIEGAGNGHNDVVMLGLLLLGLAALAAGRPRTGALAIGFAAAVKFVPLLVAPWIAAGAARAAAGRARAVAAAGGILLLAALPIALTYAPFWNGLDTLGGISDRWAYGQVATGNRRDLFVGANLVAILIYGGASMWVLGAAVRDADPLEPVRRLVTGWAMLAAAVLIVTAGGLFPWYLAWPWAATLVRWDRRHVVASAVLYALAFFLTARYALF